MAHLKVIYLAGFAALSFASFGCAQADGGSAPQCQLPPQGNEAEGPVGDCCKLRGGGDGVCLAGVCNNRRVSEPNAQCGGGTGRDMRTVGSQDMRTINPADMGGGGDEDGDVPDTGGMNEDGGGEDGGMNNPCEDVVCDAGEVCDPATGMCRPRGGGGPADACATDDDCPAGATCLSEEASNGDVPGGFCRVVCEDNNACAGGACLPSGASNICFQRCDDGEACRADWTCVQADDASICLPDCREVGCGAAEVCNADSGVCEQAPTPCRYECAAGEECTGGRCVRLNGTCVTDYHCPDDDPDTVELDGRQCHEGNCVPEEFADCQNGEGCDASQVCVPRQQGMPLAGGLCLFGCQADEDCPLHKMCYPNLNGAQACYFRVCGAGPNGDDNGTVRGPCMTGSMAQWQGSCIPLSAATPTPGFCFEAGNVPEGGACDAQNDGRAPADRALQCGQGSICFDDPDDPQDPGQNFAGRGQCVRMCNPAAPACNANRTCINFGQLDDPGTRDVDETLVQGFCLNTDCNVAVNECAGGQHCRPYSLVANEGACSPPGQTAHRQPCLRHTECAEQSFCGNTGSGPICLQVCNMGAPEPGCPDGEQCVQNQGWGFGVCL